MFPFASVPCINELWMFKFDLPFKIFLFRRQFLQQHCNNGNYQKYDKKLKTI